MNIRNRQVSVDHEAHRVAGLLADLLNRAEREKRSLTIDERIQFDKLDAELTRLVGQMPLIEQ